MGDRRKEKRGQVTIFIIIAMVIIALGFLAYAFYPKVKSTLSLQEKNPQGYIQECIQKDLQDTLTLISSQGGSVNPTNFILYNKSKVEYLCYTNENLAKLCVVQRPVLQTHIKSELKSVLENKINTCFESLKKNYETKGYVVTWEKGNRTVELLPKKTLLRLTDKVVLTKENSQVYNEFVVMINNNLYELTAIADSIVAWESEYGDADPIVYMTYYPDLKVEKMVTSDGKVYILTNRDTKEIFQFSVRGFVLI